MSKTSLQVHHHQIMTYIIVASLQSYYIQFPTYLITLVHAVSVCYSLHYSLLDNSLTLFPTVQVKVKVKVTLRLVLV
jgi:hypothetical protein